MLLQQVHALNAAALIKEFFTKFRMPQVPLKRRGEKKIKERGGRK
jgi:hypothetical protein